MAALKANNNDVVEAIVQIFRMSFRTCLCYMFLVVFISIRGLIVVERETVFHKVQGLNYMFYMFCVCTS